MSIIARTSLVPEVLGSGAAVAPMPEVSADIFRGVFVSFMDGSSVRTYDWLETQPVGTKANAIKPVFTGVNRETYFSTAVGAGVYGDDCMAVNVIYWPFTTNFAVDNETLNSPSHGLQNDDKVWVVSQSATTGLSGTTPAGLDNSWAKDTGLVPYYVVSAAENSFKLSLTVGGAAVQFTSDGSGNHWVTTTGLPEWWFMPSENIGVAQGWTPANDGKYFVPKSGRPYNRMEIFVKAPLGYRSLFSQSTDSDNLDFGTYHQREALLGEEGDNKHYYLQPMIRYDQAGEEWIRVRFNPQPTHNRGISGTPCVVEPIVEYLDSEGTFYDTLTRWYWQDTRYWAPPEIAGANQVLYDRLRFYYEEPKHPITVEWDTADRAVDQYVTMDGATETFFYFTFTNSGPVDITGTMFKRGYWALNAQIQTTSGTDVSGTSITIPANGTWQGRLRLMPTAGVSSEGKNPPGPLFVPNDQFNGTGNPSFSDANIRHKQDSMPLDAHTYGAGLRIFKLV